MYCRITLVTKTFRNIFTAMGTRAVCRGESPCSTSAQRVNSDKLLRCCYNHGMHLFVQHNTSVKGHVIRACEALLWVKKEFGAGGRARLAPGNQNSLTEDPELRRWVEHDQALSRRSFEAKTAVSRGRLVTDPRADVLGKEMSAQFKWEWQQE